MNDYPQQGDEESLVPLFTLSPQQVGPRTRPGATATEDPPHVVFGRDHTFGYNVRLEDFTPDTNFPGWGDEEEEYQDHPQRSKRSILLIVTVAFLGMAAALVATQPSARSAVSSVAGHFFNGSNTDVQQVAPPSPTGDVLALGGNSTPTPGADPTADPSATPMPTDPGTADTPAPLPSGDATAAPTPGPTPAAPIFVTGTFGTASTCQSGKAAGATCTWQVNIAGGNPLYADIQWEGGAALQMTIADAAGNPLFTQSSASGVIQASIPSPPASVWVHVTVTSGSNVTYTVGLAAHSF